MKKCPKPWLDDDGRERSIEELQVLSRSWDGDTWERYLKNSVEKSQKESSLKKGFYSDFLSTECICFSELIDDGENLKKYKQFFPLVEQAINKLSGSKLRLLKLYYVEGLTDREIAHRLKEKVSTIKMRRHRVIKEIRKNLFLDRANSQGEMNISF